MAKQMLIALVQLCVWILSSTSCIKAQVVPKYPFDVEDSCEKMHDALRGLGTIGVDEGRVIDILVTMTNSQRQEMVQYYQTAFGEDLHSEFRIHLTYHLEDTCRSLIDRPALFDAKELRKAMKGIGSDESTLIEIICARTPEELEGIKIAYEEELGRDLINDLQWNSCYHFERLLVAQVSGERDTSDEVDAHLAHEEAEKLYDAGEGMWGTEESQFISILSLRNYHQLKKTFEEYEEIAGKSIEDTIKDEMQFNMQEGCLWLVKFVKNPTNYFAKRLYKSMKGLFTDKDTLRRVIVYKSETDILNIRQAFEQKYGENLREWIDRECYFDFKKILLRMVGDY